MTKHTVGILGGTGFVGSQLATRLVSEGHDVRVLSRHPERYRSLTVLPTLKVIKLIDFEVDLLLETLSDCDVVINLIGILNESGHNGKEFRKVHVDYTKNVVKACKALGINRYLHMSALAADQARGTSHYLRSKGQAEDWVHQQATDDFAVTSFRPSIIFGPGDNFFNHFAKLLNTFPVFPVPCADTLYAPVYIGDVVSLMVKSIDACEYSGKRFELVGPKNYKLSELIQYIATLTQANCKIISLNKGLSYFMGLILEYFPGKPFSLDNYYSAQLDSLSNEKLPDFANWQPKALEVIVPTYLGPETRSAIISEQRMRSGR